ncbi:LLM class flavin-dependent oxidoreductase, partial [Streptomyces sp. SID10244]|nr:LLM class flavin-dependent oxidoreductase [Streptomyces sp. SID10244]
GETFDHPGGHYPISESPGLPKPTQSPRPPIIVGGTGKKRTPALAARFGDEFNAAFQPVDEARAQFERVGAAVGDAGRSADSITYSAALVLCCGAN